MEKSLRDRIKKLCNQPKGSFKGQFFGSSYRFHPHGVCRDGFLIYDHHNVNDYITAAVAENPFCDWTPAKDDSCASIDPLPKPIGCSLVKIYGTGGDIKEGPWVPKLYALIDQLEAEAKESEVRREHQAEKERLEEQRRQSEFSDSLKKAWA